MQDEILKVRVIADTKDMESGFGKITSEMKKVESAGDSLGSKLVSIGKTIAGAFVVKKVVEFGAEAVNAAAKYKALDSAFAQVFQGMEAEAKTRMDAVAASIGAIPTRIQPAFNQIASFVKVTGMSTAESLGFTERAMVAVGDSAAFQDKSIEELTNVLQSYLKGNYEVADSLGIVSNESTRTAAATEMFGKKFNELDAAQQKEVLLKMFEDANKVSGVMGQAARETGGLENSLGNLKEAGKLFMSVMGAPMLQLVVDAIVLITNEVMFLVEAIKGFDWSVITNSAPFVFVKEVIEGVRTKIGELLTAATEFNWGAITDSQLFEVIKGAFQWIIDNIPAAVEQIGLFVQKIVESEPAQAIFNGIKDAATILADKLLNIKDSATAFSDWISANSDLLVGLGTFFGSIAAMVGLYNLAMAIATGVTGIWTGIAGAASLATTAIGVAFLSINWPLVLIVGAIAAVIAIGVLLWKNWETVKSKAQEIFSNVASFVSEKMNAVETTVGNVLDAVKNFFTEKLNAAKTTVSTTLDAIKNFFTEKLNAAKTTVSTVFDNIKTAISDKMEAAKEKVSTTLDNIKTDFTNKFNDAKTSVTNIFDNIKTAISDKINAAKDAVSQAVDKIKGFFNFSWKLPDLKLPHFSMTGSFSLNPPSIPTIGVSWYARGGIFNKPTVLGGVGVGDASNGHGSAPEVVAPLDNLKQMLGLDEDKGDTTINLYGSYMFNDRAMMDEFLNKMALNTKRRA